MKFVKRHNRYRREKCYAQKCYQSVMSCPINQYLNRLSNEKKIEEINEIFEKVFITEHKFDSLNSRRIRVY